MRWNTLNAKRSGRKAWAVMLMMAAWSLSCLAMSCLAQPAGVATHTPREVRVLASVDLEPALPAIADAFEHATGIKLIASYGSSSTLAMQIVNGDPADLFLGADFSFPERVVSAGLADTPEPIPYARGTLVLWAAKDSPLQPLTQNTLREGKFTSLAIADPEHAPYGRAAVDALTRMKLYDTLKPKLVIADNVRRAAELVESGGAQLGLISLTAASTQRFEQEGTLLLMPPGSYLAIRQCAVVMKKSEHRGDAHAFLDWLRTPAIQKNLKQYGLGPVDTSPIAP